MAARIYKNLSGDLSRCYMDGRVGVSPRIGTLPHPTLQTNTITKRDYRNIDAHALRNDITSVCSDKCACTNDRQADELVHVYNTCLTDCLDNHAPWRNVRVGDKTPHPWYDTDIDVARNKKQKQGICGEEQNWRFIYNYTLTSARKMDYFRNQLEKASDKNMFRLMRSLDGQRVQQQTEFRLAAQECELFSRFFRGKIDNLLSGLQCFNDIDRPSDERRCFTYCIDLFDRTTSTAITAICCATKKTCWIFCRQISSLTTSPVLCLPSHGSQMLLWARE